MPNCQNLRFKATVLKDGRFDHPPGEPLMRRLYAALATSGWCTNDMDNWRDCGWSFSCQRGHSKISVVLCQIPNQEWLLQIAPERNPGFVGRLIGRNPSATFTEVYALAVDVQHALSSLQSLKSPRWRWDGFPDDTHSTVEPLAV
jgi:hypothetical protein